ncbi:MAG: YhgE/Pip family protein [Muricomes sp.]
MNRLKQHKQTVVRLAVIIGVIIIPLMYSFFYLDAFWDPYSRLEKLPVAVVNLDKGAVINGTDRNLGQEMCDELKEDGTLKFIVTDPDDAKQGTDGQILCSHQHSGKFFRVHCQRAEYG